MKELVGVKNKVDNLVHVEPCIEPEIKVEEEEKLNKMPRNRFKDRRNGFRKATEKLFQEIDEVTESSDEQATER